MSANIQQLREVARLCQMRQPLDGDLAQWLASSLEDFLNRRARTIADAMGIRGPHGGVPWWMEEAIRCRDAALRALVRDLSPGAAVHAQARLVHRLTVRYAASTWRFHQQLEMPPPAFQGTANQHLRRAFKSGAPMPIGQRQLRNILAH